MAALAGQTLMEAAGGPEQAKGAERVTPATATSALGMASLAGQALMEAAGTTVEGTMDVDEDESSGDSPRISKTPLVKSAPPKPTVTTADAEAKKQLQKQLGESSEDEEDEPPKQPKQQPKSMPLPKSKIARQFGDSEDDDNSDIEREMKKAAADAAASRSLLGG
ncbi:unnamed protein product [Durusdinium trenchii]|uniref:Uncharacterized protein n=1 Tax=Durusdinium trenchii TaxID=1381693 RepID=A0ABP0S6U4_9DINO